MAFKEDLANRWKEKIKVGKLLILYRYNWKRVNNQAGLNILERFKLAKSE